MIARALLSALAMLVFTLGARTEYVPSGPLTTYWDCCKPSAAWLGAAPVYAPARSCARDGHTILRNTNAQSACGGGPAYTCSFYQPFVKDGYGYAFSARNMANPRDVLCGCYRITIKHHPGKVLITQVLNEGPLSEGQFDLAVPGGGVGDFNACVSEFSSPPNGWGRRMGGVQSDAECNGLPTSLQHGCHWKFSFFAPEMYTESVRRVQCPAVLTRISGCVRKDDHVHPHME
ncbi:hypothetical protein V8E36_000259 [Tilletia maclaganii]